MKYLITTIVILCTSIFSLHAEEIKNNTISIEYHKDNYTPFSFDVIKSYENSYTSNINQRSQSGNLKNNDIDFIKIKYHFITDSKNYGFNISYYSFLLDDAYRRTDNIYNFSPTNSHEYFVWNRDIITPIKRTEAKGSLYKYFDYGAYFLGAGIGIRNLNFYQTFNSMFQYMFEDIRTYGPQLSFFNKFIFLNDFSINLSLDFFKTYGKRIFEEANFAPYKNMGSNNTWVSLTGYEMDLSLQYKLNSSVSFTLGYTYNKSKLKYYDYETSNFYLDWRYAETVYNRKHSDSLNGYYFGVNTHF